jgi:hypothetical protein
VKEPLQTSFCQIKQTEKKDEKRAMLGIDGGWGWFSRGWGFGDLRLDIPG